MKMPPKDIHFPISIGCAFSTKEFNAHQMCQLPSCRCSCHGKVIEGEIVNEKKELEATG